MKSPLIIGTMLLVTLASCATNIPEKIAVEKESAQAIVSSKIAYNVDDYYQVYQAGRIYVFDDFKVYQEFIDLGETTFRLTRIGAGSKGETVVFGLRKQDKKTPLQSGVVNMYDGKVEGIEKGFYAEVIQERRVYIFNEWTDLQSFLKVGEATFRYTDIGAGKSGETLVYVLNKNNKKQRPAGLMAEYKRRHQ